MRASADSISPFFIVRDLAAALAFYRDRLGFDVVFEGPEDDRFFGIVSRGDAMIMLKDVGVEPLPNHQREPMARGMRTCTCCSSGGRRTRPDRHREAAKPPWRSGRGAHGTPIASALRASQ